jgi:hypothetical protein
MDVFDIDLGNVRALSYETLIAFFFISIAVENPKFIIQVCVVLYPNSSENIRFE